MDGYPDRHEEVEKEVKDRTARLNEKASGRTKLFVVIVWCCVLFPGLAAAADRERNRVYKVGISSWTSYPTSVQGFKDAMSAGGFVEGQNVIYLYGESGSNPSRHREIAQSFRDAGVDLVYSLTTPGTIIMKEIMPETTPIVFSIVTYPADSGLIESFDYSGNNLVGTSNYVELTNYIKLLKIVLPQARNVAIFRRKKEPNSKMQAANIIRLAKKEDIHVIDLPLESIDEVRETASKLVGQVDVFMTTTDTLMQGGGEEALIAISLDKRIPILSSNKIGIEQGSTFGVVTDFYVLGKMSAEMAARILKENIKPARLQSKIQEPPLTVINRKSLKLLGISVPEDKIQNVEYVE
ncbi:MAG: ABC transporter substrate-binding protein [Desulfomonilaceae bacterium]